MSFPIRKPLKYRLPGIVSHNPALRHQPGTVVVGGSRIDIDGTLQVGNGSIGIALEGSYLYRSAFRKLDGLSFCIRVAVGITVK